MTQALVAVNNATYGGVYYSNNVDFTNPAVQPTWTRLSTTGLANLLIKDMRNDPIAPYDKIYIQLTNGDVYLYNGSSWDKIMDLATAQTLVGWPGFIDHISLDNSQAGLIYIPVCRTGYGLEYLYSTDYGANWTNVVVTGFFTHPANIAAQGPHIHISVGSIYRSVHYSSNGGVSFVDHNLWVNSGGGPPIRLNPHDPTRIYNRLTAVDYNLTVVNSTTVTTLQNGYNLGSDSQDRHWIDPLTSGHQRILRYYGGEVTLFSTIDDWANLVTSTPPVLIGSATAYGALHCARENDDYIMFGSQDNDLIGQKVYALNGETSGTTWGISGANFATPPYTNAIPNVTNLLVANQGIFVGDASASTGIEIYSVEHDAYDTGHTPKRGDRSSWRDMDADTNDAGDPNSYSHAEDIQETTPQRHNPWPAASGTAPVSDGSKYVATDITTQAELTAHTGNPSAHHAPVTLAADADAVLGLSGQELNLDAQDANKVLAGPTIGGAADPGFRLLVAADIPAHTLDSHSDVDLTGALTGDIIYDNAGTWEDYALGVGTTFVVAGNKLRIGGVGGGNYFEIDRSSGTVRLIGTATSWEDVRVAASITKAGATAPSYKAFGPSGSLKALMFEAGHHDEVHFEAQLPHSWKEGSKIYPHVHWTPTTADAGNVVWELEYAWANIDGTFGAPGNMASAATAAGGTAWVHKMTALVESGNNYIDGTGKTISSMLVCRLHRNSNAGSDTLNQDVALLEFDFHCEIDSFGSDTETAKNESSIILLETGDKILLETNDKMLLE